MFVTDFTRTCFLAVFGGVIIIEKHIEFMLLYMYNSETKSSSKCMQLLINDLSCSQAIGCQMIAACD